MNFRLIYEGPLSSSRSATPKEKQAIRRVLHPQLAELWRQPPLLGLVEEHSAFNENAFGPGNVLMIVRRGNFAFVPVVSTRLKLICHLDILFLRPGPPGSLVGHGGDIDNRLKTLFDALQMPDLNQVTDEVLLEGETPFFCLLEDDALVTRVTVETDRLLKGEGSPIEPSRVLLVLNVTLKATELMYLNMDLVS